MLRDHGMSQEKRYHHVELGYNYRMTNMQAAIGVAQLERLNETLKVRRKQMDFYYYLLQKIDEVQVRKFEKWCTPVHWLMTLSIDEKYNRDDFLKYMKKQGIDSRQMINPVHHAQQFVALFRC